MKFNDLDIGYIQPKKGKFWIQETRELSDMLVGFINSIKNSNQLSVISNQ